MPVPKPNDTETKEEFISRCMGDKVMQEYDQKQRAAICYNSWGEKKDLTTCDGHAKMVDIGGGHFMPLIEKMFAAVSTQNDVLMKAIGVSEIADGEMWALASVEVPDTVSDKIMIDGIDYTTYHQPENGISMKILAQHQKFSEVTGKDFVLGKVLEFRKVNVPVGDNIAKALAFRMKWDIQDELGNYYYEKYKRGTLDSFSVGLLAVEFDKNKQKGFDYKKTLLYEISSVSIPANTNAIKVANLGDNMENVKKDESNNDYYGTDKFHESISKSMDELCSMTKSLHQKMDSLMKKMDENDVNYSKSLSEANNLIGIHSKTLLEVRDSIDGRLDFLETQLVTNTDNAPKVSDSKAELSKEIVASEFKSLLDSIQKLSK